MSSLFRGLWSSRFCRASCNPSVPHQSMLLTSLWTHPDFISYLLSSHLFIRDPPFYQALPGSSLRLVWRPVSWPHHTHSVTPPPRLCCTYKHKKTKITWFLPPCPYNLGWSVMSCESDSELKYRKAIYKTFLVINNDSSKTLQSM